jgi:hypothetical protein
VRRLLAILLMTASVIAVAPSAQAGEGGALAAGLLGGLAAGTMIGIAASNPYPPPPPPVYIAPEPVACYWTRGSRTGTVGAGSTRAFAFANKRRRGRAEIVPRRAA